MYKELLFDLDGTLTDPKVGITKSVQYALHKSGVHEKNLDNLVPFIGPPLQDSFKKYYEFDEDRSWDAVLHYREYFSENGMYENVVYEGIPELLQELHDRQKSLHVVTSKPAYFAEQIVSHVGLKKYFKQVVGPELDLRKSTKADMIERVLVQFSHDQRDTFVMIGDREHDIIGANQTGIKSVGVTYGYGRLQELTQARPTHIAHSVAKLKKVLIE